MLDHECTPAPAVQGQRRYLIHTDGACRGNPGPGGWAAVLQLFEGETEIKRKEISGAVRQTTNNQMELTAALMALRMLKEKTIPITVRSDSEYVVKGMSEWLPKWKANGWRNGQKRPVVNKELWEALDAFAEGMPGLAWEWVRGHNGDALNERCDALANAAVSSSLQSPKQGASYSLLARLAATHAL